MRIQESKSLLFILLLILIFSTSCINYFFSSESVKSGNELKKDEIEFIERLGLLDKDEKIELLYSLYNIKSDCYFITNKRIASYPMAPYTSMPEDKGTYFAFYNEIDTMYVKFSGDLEGGNQIFVEKKNGEKFFLYVYGEMNDMLDFFKTAEKHWHLAKNSETF